MIFPDLKDKKFGYVNLNTEAKEWAAGKKFGKDEKPLLDPIICQDMVESVHAKYDLHFSYGGWMEDRSFLWHGSYLEESAGFIHLGIDLNVPSGTAVALDFDAEVVKIDDDYPEQGGWGPRIIVKHLAQSVYVIYAHLDKEILCKVGDILKQGSIIARVGKAPYNGNWFPHLHVQIISKDYFDALLAENSFDDLDGYGSPTEMKENAERFPDPMQYISLV